MKLKKLCYLLIVLLFSSSMYSKGIIEIEDKMTDTEIKLINNKDEHSAFNVLLTTEKIDSLFLREKAKDVDLSEEIVSNEVLQRLIKRMKVTLLEEEGVGLAAPQIGVSRNLFLFLRLDKPKYPIQVAINPKIVNHPKNVICFEGDGCLSIPDESGDTARYPWVEVEYYDEQGKLHQERLNGGSREEDFTGIIFQHEFDHLQGILFTDRLYDKVVK